jgi:hypothetical protein
MQASLTCFIPMCLGVLPVCCADVNHMHSRVRPFPWETSAGQLPLHAKGSPRTPFTWAGGNQQVWDTEPFRDVDSLKEQSRAV